MGRCHQRVLSDRLSLRGAYESTTARESGSPQVATGYTLRFLVSGRRTGAVTPELLPSAPLSRPRFGPLPGSGPSATNPASPDVPSLQLDAPFSLVQSIGLPGQRVWYADCCSNVRLPWGATRRRTTVDCMGLGGEQRLVPANEGKPMNDGQADMSQFAVWRWWSGLLRTGVDACGQLARIP
mgnify:CR=1 FL=1